ncbi:uncharacterized skeletal organic matrix protein 5-like [Corticium candelabrum]|uniref:uncharacterized skeletal organic matrix protein 5-like n=1 Tax=Corticium candelabrum TaxID=121492 RepID=UPI002E255069|nr:uncharacterized skeletal organic matrix protein 5-like [Corticium candelabrum]
MKLDGSQQTFSYDNAIWSNKQTFQSKNLELDNKETKLASYWTLPFTEVRLGMKVDGTIRWITFSHLSTVSLQMDVTGERALVKDGFNAKSHPTHARTRLGFIANQENNCGNPGSFVGFGTRYKSHANSAGNCAGSTANDNGSLDIKVIGYIMAR